MHLSLDSVSTMISGNNGKLTFTPTKETGYTIHIMAMETNFDQNIEVTLTPSQAMYFNSYYKKDDINTAPDVSDIQSTFNQSGIYLKNEVNSTLGNFLQRDSLGNFRINQRFYMITSHGREDGRVLLSPTTEIIPREFPLMNNTEIAVFSICFGGLPGNVAEFVVNNRAVRNASGWNNTIGVSTSNTYIKAFCHEVIVNKQNVQNASSRAVAKVRSSHPLLYLTGF